MWHMLQRAGVSTPADARCLRNDAGIGLGHFFSRADFQTAGYLLPEPYIVIDVVLHQLLHVFVRASLDVGGNAINRRALP